MSSAAFKFLFSFLISLVLAINCFSQQLVFPENKEWTLLEEGQPISIKVNTSESTNPVKFFIEGGDGMSMQLDSLGSFSWTPSYDFVSRLEIRKEVTVIFQADWADGKKVRTPITFIVNHKNRPPVVEDLPIFYVRQSTQNQYQISPDYVSDPDGDPLVFKSIQSQMPEGVVLSSLGLITWTPSRNQFRSLKNNALTIEFIIQDQPDKAETKGKIKIAQTQLDLPPEILLIPNDSLVTIKEDELINLKLYFSDPNGDENISASGFVCSDQRIPKGSLKENTLVQSEFTWTPGYEFVDEATKFKNVEIMFFALDKSNNRVQRKIIIKVLDAENLDVKDKVLFEKYRSSLIQTKELIDKLDVNHEVLNHAYKKAKKGKRNTSILNAGLGATTGLSPVVLETGSSKIVSALGGTATLTLGTLEATEVLGKSKADILDKQKINIEIRNQAQLEGDNFARKYAIKSSRRNKEFDADRDKLLPIINHQKLVLLELDATRNPSKRTSIKDIKKTFTDFSEE
jgi:hypothetical protein